MVLNEVFREYLEEAIGKDNSLVAFSAFERPASSSVRINPFKSGPVPEGREVFWNRHGRILAQRPVFTLDPSFHGGAYYVQDSSSMFVGHVFRQLVKPVIADSGNAGPVRVLDLCAAPGGKTTDLAVSLREMLGDRFVLVSNEVMKQRASVLADNVALWGDPNVVVTSDDPRAFAGLTEFFDIIIADVPCSGEGMFRKDEEAQRQWSPDNVSHCQARQRRIVADVWPSLKSGGIFIYSTCTFNRFENDGNVSWMLDSLGAEPLLDNDVITERDGVLKTEFGYSLVPGFVEGEGQYCSAVRKVGEYADIRSIQSARQGKPAVRVQSDVLQKMFTVEMAFRQKGDLITAVPGNILSDVETLERCLHVLSAGCAVGIFKGKDFVPDADLALCIAFRKDFYDVAEVSSDQALAYLHKDPVFLPDHPKGLVLICHAGVPLGFVKNLGNRCNSLHPQHRRIRMEVRNK